MKDVMLADTPIEERERILRDSCDKIVEKNYTKKFSQSEMNEKRMELADVSIRIAELDQELAEIRADFKGRIKPLVERLAKIRDEIKAGGAYVLGECFQFIDVDEGKSAIYTPEGYKIEERDLKPGDRVMTIHQQIRKDSDVFSRTGTDD